MLCATAGTGMALHRRSGNRQGHALVKEMTDDTSLETNPVTATVE